MQPTATTASAATSAHFILRDFGDVDEVALGFERRAGGVAGGRMPDAADWIGADEGTGVLAFNQVNRRSTSA
jgi:hypothetical protein